MMEYKKLFEKENESVKERYELAIERISAIEKEKTIPEPFLQYFRSVAGFILTIGKLYEMVEKGTYRCQEINELEQWNQQLYEDILPRNYDTSFADPAYSVKILGEELGNILSYLYVEIRGEIAFAMESRLTEITILDELFIEIYNLFEGEIPNAQSVKEAIYWFNSDYTDLTVAYRIRELVDPELSFGKDIVMDSNLKDLRYLYYYGEYVSEEEKRIAEFLNGLPQETIDLMAHTYTEGYRKGFKVMGRDLSKKKTVAVLYELGFERMVRKAVEYFREMDLEPIIYRTAVWSVNKNPNRKRGFHGTSPNRQYDYDHRYDCSLYFKKGFTDRKLAVLKGVYETWKKQAGQYAGPALIETFGEDGYAPVNKKESLLLNEKQEKLLLSHTNEASQTADQYIPGGETSFTIIAFPKPSIGEHFEEIFEETIKINTLDYERYKEVQQAIIDKLDLADYVVITGKGKNKTNLKVKLHELKQPEKETNFENCVADINIPLGEVFTSPMLSGTEGILEVSTVYIGDIRFTDLKMEFKEGKVISYSCSNFEDEKQGKALVKQVILKNHESLPMGEFAIGTNTTAYTMAKKFGIEDKLPILIMEKTGPHFAVGDTCYSRSEDVAVYNPDDKEIIARDNEISILRKTDIGNAYFNCHTDITIPYGELGEIYGVSLSGEKLPIIADGRFVAEGTKMLNEALSQGD